MIVGVKGVFAMLVKEIDMTYTCHLNDGATETEQQPAIPHGATLCSDGRVRTEYWLPLRTENGKPLRGYVLDGDFYEINAYIPSLGKCL